MDGIYAGVHSHLAMRLVCDPGELELALAHLGGVAAAGSLEFGRDVEAKALRNVLRVLVPDTEG